MTGSAPARPTFVSVRDAGRYYPAAGRRADGSRSQLAAVDHVDLDIAPGECLALVGESGSGKSTLARLILGLTSLTFGSVSVDGIDLAAATREQVRTFRRTAQIIFQDPYSSLDPRFSIRDIVAEGLAHLSRAARRERVDEMLHRVGLPGDFADRYPHQLSGGQRQRVGIARALAVSPRFLVLDEPVSALDVSMQAQILNLLSDLRAELGLTYLFISHDLSVVRHVSDRIAVMYMGKIVEIAATSALLDAPQHPYTQALLSAMPSVRREDRRVRISLVGDPPSPVDPPANCRFATRCFRVADRCRQEAPPLSPIGTGDRSVACFYPGPITAGETRSTLTPTRQIEQERADA